MDLVRFLSPEGRVAGYERLEDALGRALELARKDPGAGGRSPAARACRVSLTRLTRILVDAYDQAAKGKGKERHAGGRPWTDQPIFLTPKLLGCGAFNLGQAVKKLCELQNLPHKMACAEALGAIVYLASAIVLVDESADPWEQPVGWAEQPAQDIDAVLGELAQCGFVRDALVYIEQASFGVYPHDVQENLLGAILAVVKVVDALDADHAGCGDECAGI
jgi:hypothetical protein